MYAQIDEVADCGCIHCLNYRAAWTTALLDDDLLAACSILGIVPQKSLEMSVIESSAPSRLVYHGTLPFIGELLVSMASAEHFFRWGFTSDVDGTARIAQTDLVAINFLVSVPWVLPDHKLPHNATS